MDIEQQQVVDRRRAERVNLLARAFVDAVSVDKPFYTALLAKFVCRTANDCTGGNLETCKILIVRDILPSWRHTVALCRFLECLAEHFEPEPAAGTTPLRRPNPRMFEHAGLGLDINGEMQQPPANSTRRVNLVKIMNEVLAYCGTREDTAFHKEWVTPRVLDVLKRVTIRLFRLAACRADPVEVRHNALPLWELHHTWTNTLPFTFDIDFQREATMAFKRGESTKHAEVVAQNAAERVKASQLQTPSKPYNNTDYHTKIYLPHRHSVKGSPNAPWHQLPAANGLYMASTRGYPLRAGAFPKEGYPLRSGGQEADAALSKDVKNLHQEMISAFEDFTDPSEVQDIDPLGSKVWKDPERPTRNYWGFSYQGLEMIKQNRKKFREQAKGYADVAPLRDGQFGGAMDDLNAAVARARELAASRGFGDRGRGRGGRGGGGTWRGGHDRGRGGYRGRGPRQW